MSTYLIGDVQGCFDSLQALLTIIHFDPKKDRLGFVGDLINRGPKSLETLRFIMQLKNPMIVLGNHDLHLLALYFLRDHDNFTGISHTLDSILNAADCDQLIHFLLQQPLLLREKNLVMVHAGIPPQWSVDSALHYAKEIEQVMRKDPHGLFTHIYGNKPAAWHDDLPRWERIRYIVNAFTRMRFCTDDGTLDLETKSDTAINEKYKPWFSWVHRACDIYFGHWASLEGRCDQARVFALDTGCAWGGKLTAIRIEDHQLFSVPAIEPI